MPNDAPGSGARPTLILLVGAPGTGKSTLASALRSVVPGALIQTDAIRKGLVRAPTYRPSESAWVHRVAQQRLRRELRAGQNVIFDATNLRRSYRKQIADIAQENNAQLITLVTWAPESVIRSRLERRHELNDPDDRSDADWNVYLHLRKSFEPVTEPHIVVNTTVDREPVLRTVKRLVEGSGAPPSSSH